MTALPIGYGKADAWVQSDLNGTHLPVLKKVAWMILCLSVPQRLNPAAFAQALRDAEPGSGRKSVAVSPKVLPGCWDGPALSNHTLTPRLVRAALAFQPVVVPVLLALDTIRVGGGETWYALIVVAGHTLPVAWAAIRYPWPKGRFREATAVLVGQLAATCAPGYPWTLVARSSERLGCPSVGLFARLREWKAG